MAQSIKEGSSIMRATVTFDGNLADDPHVRLTGSGKQITELTVLVNQRRQNCAGVGRSRADPARGAGVQDPRREHRRVSGEGDRVLVHGTVTTEAWTDKQTGEMRTRPAGAGRGRRAEPALGQARITKTTGVKVGDQARDDVPGEEAEASGKGARRAQHPGALSTTPVYPISPEPAGSLRRVLGADRGAKWCQAALAEWAGEAGWLIRAVWSWLL
jgi:single-strand DNA-binding protein